MKQLLPFLFIFLFSFASCQKSNEELVKQEFKSYVQNNFDDPSSIREIVSILPADTMSVAILKDVLKRLIDTNELVTEMVDMNDSIFDSEIEKIATACHRGSNLSYSNRQDAARCIDQVAKLIYKKVPIQKRQDDALTNAMNYLHTDYQYQPPKYGYDIKFRQEVDGKITLKIYTAYIDSLSKDVTIQQGHWKIDGKDPNPQMRVVEKSVYDLSRVIDSWDEVNNSYKEINHKVRMITAKI